MKLHFEPPTGCESAGMRHLDVAPFVVSMFAITLGHTGAAISSLTILAPGRHLKYLWYGG